MQLPPIDTAPQLAKVISISEVRARYRLAQCAHRSIIVDEMLATVECKDCGEKLNAIAVLARFGREELQWQHSAKALNDARKKLDERVRCKCQHCGQMTRIKV